MEIGASKAAMRGDRCGALAGVCDIEMKQERQRTQL